MTRPTPGSQVTGTRRQELAAEAKDWYLQGCTIQSTADRIGRSYGATRVLLLEAGVKLRPRGGMRTRFGSADRR
ncbi:helix-turn-helix domain-containing protein [Streptomyces sp. NPDC050388]|uniref:helix-turn-helix domain-containing protein n=1 Tax=Streptomyces sp. NPDC050388 TaxID=3155781 RepID=UPI00341C1FF3